jgi:molybdopterin molybdotransferase
MARTKYTDALKKVLANTKRLPVEEKLITKCTGQVAAEDVRSPYSLPMTNTGGPDGYAVRAKDVIGATKDTPIRLRVIGTVRAGQVPKKTITPGTAMRIMTGSAVPDGADCVVYFEDTDEPGNKNGPNPNLPRWVQIYAAPKAWDNVRPAGSTPAGLLVMPQGTSIGPAQISALAAVGKTRLKVYRRPVCAVIASGDELIGWNQTLKPGKVYNCNAAAIAAMVTHYGGIPRILGIARDRESSLAVRIQQALTADVIITTGGVSMGDYDIVRLFMAKNGNLILARLAMGPGASFAYGTMMSHTKNAEIPFFGLAGPPTGCLNNFETLVRPALMKMMGFTAVEHPVVEAVSDDAVANEKDVDFIRWTELYKKQGAYHVLFNASKGGSMYGGMTTTNSMVIIPEHHQIHKGDKVTVMPLDWCRDYQVLEK